MALFDNKTLANIFYETADLMEIKGDDPFRIRSYRRAAEAIEGLGQSIADIIGDQKALLAIPGIGKGMCQNLQEIFKEGKLRLHSELLEKYRPTMLELLKIQGLGPKTISLIWDVFQISDLEGVEKLAREGKLRTLPRMGEKAEQKILKGIEDYRRISGRYHLDAADAVAQKLIEHLKGAPGVEKITPAGSLRRGRETVGDLDILVTGKASTNGKQREALIARILAFPGILQTLAQGENKVSIKLRHIQGDVHMHTVETDGRNTIEEMAEAARARGYQYMAITDHSKNLAFANGLDDKRAEEHIRRIHAADRKMEGIRIFAGIEVDILAEGELDLSDSVLAQMDLVIASVHSHFQQEPKQMTERLLRALGNKHVSIIGHPTGRILLRRDAYQYDMDAVLKAAAANKIAMEHNAYPDRLDLSDVHLRMARERGVKIVINTDAHHISHMDKIRYGVLQARRAWLTKSDVLNTLPVEKFAAAMKRG